MIIGQIWASSKAAASIAHQLQVQVSKYKYRVNNLRTIKTVEQTSLFSLLLLFPSSPSRARRSLLWPTTEFGRAFGHGGGFTSSELPYRLIS